MNRNERVPGAAFLVVSLVLAGVLLLVLLEPKSILSPVTETSMTTVTLPYPVTTAVDAWVYDLSSRDVDSLASLYTQNATLVWTNEPGLSGIYNPENNVRLLYQVFFGRDTALAISIANSSQTVTGTSTWNATFYLAGAGSSPAFGGFNFNAKVTQDWNYTGGDNWQVWKENWNFTSFSKSNH